MIRCRVANEKDVDSLIELMNNTFYSQYIYPNKTNQEIKIIILKLMKSRNYLVCVDYENKKKIIGYFIFDSINSYLKDSPVKLKKNYAYHLGIGVNSDYRKKGIGKRLTIYAFKKVKELGFKGMYADVGSNNDISINLQNKSGFKELIRYNSKYRPKGIKNVIFIIDF
jgi:ribosomal protein S18 acetylase RimI-like enzyme